MFDRVPDRIFGVYKYLDAGTSTSNERMNNHIDKPIENPIKHINNLIVDPGNDPAPI